MTTYAPLPVTMTSANEIVVEQIDRLNGLADDLVARTENALDGLQESYINTAVLDPRLFWSDGDLDALLGELGTIPNPDLTGDWLDNVNLPATGNEFVFSPQVLALLQQQLPDYALPPAPTLPTMPEEPADPGEPTAIPAPVKPLLGSFEAPDTDVGEVAPVYTDFTASVPVPTPRPLGDMPVVPTLQLDTIAFEGVRPVFDDIVAPDPALFQFAQTTYQPLLVDDLKSAILRVLQGGTGIDPAVENALFERARERETELGERELDQISTEFAAKNWKYPPGAMARRRDNRRREASLKVSELNREQFVTRWQLEVEQFRAVLAGAISLEELWTRQFAETERLRFDAAKMRLDFALQVFNALIAKVNAQGQMFAVEAQVYRDRLAAEESKIHAYAAELEAKRLIGELNAQDITLYAERIKALLANADIYRARVDGFVGKFRKVDADLALFREQLGSNQTLAALYESDARAFGTLVEAQKSRDERFGVKAQIYSTKTEGVAKQIDALLANYNQNFKIAELRRDTFIANNDRIKTMIAAESGRIDAIVKRYEAIAAQIAAKSEVEKARYTLLLSFAQAQIERMKAAADILLKNGEINIQSALQAQSIMLRARETAATTLAQLAAGLTSAAGVQASISNSYGNTIGYDYNGQLDIN